MVYIGTMITLLFLSFANYRIHKRDILEPSVLLCIVFVGAFAFGIYNYQYWKLSDYLFQTAACITAGVISFSIGSFLGDRIRFTKRRKKKVIGKTGRIEINPITQVCCILISILTMTLFIRYFVSSGGTIRSLGVSLISFKALKRSAEISLQGYLNLLIKTTTCISIIVVIVFINNAIQKKIKLIDYLSLINVLAYIVVCFFNTTRGLVLSIALGGFAAWYILWHRIRKKPYTVAWIFVKKGIRLATIILVLFWLYAVFRNKGTNSNLDFSFMTYICNYVSGALAALDVYFKQGGNPCRWFGEETFVTLNNNLNSLFGIYEQSSRVLEYRSFSGYQVVNIYTTFRRIFHDFGWTGIAFLPAIQGWISSKVYSNVKKAQYKSSVDFGLVFYSFYFITIVYVAIEDTFFTSEISITGLIKAILLYVVYRVMFYKVKQD